MPVPKRSACAAAACLALAGCTIEDGPIYDIPAREQAHSLSLEIDRDGTPAILAQTNMYFTTTAKRGAWEPLYNSINTQTVLYLKTGDAWKTHPFKNLSHPWGYSPKWARNAQGALQPLVWDRDRLNLYAGSASAWGLQSRRVVPEPGPFWGYGDTPHLAITGAGGWHRLTYGSGTGSLLVTDENGVSARLDTAISIYPIEFLQGKDWLGVIARSETYSADAIKTYLVWYRWNRDLAHAAPRRTVVDSLERSTATYIIRERDEWRLLAFMEGDSLAEWALRGERFERVEGRPWPWATSDSARNPAQSGYANGSLMADSLGCLHDFSAIMSRPDTGLVIGQPGKPLLRHRSTCSAEPDTVDLGKLAPGKEEMIVSHNTRVAPDGTLYMAVAAQEQKNDYIGDKEWANRPVLPSHIGMASKRPGGKWVYETVASY